MIDVTPFELRALKQFRLVLLLVGLLVIHLVGCAGEDGTSCTVTQDDETGAATIDCEDGTSAVVQGVGEDSMVWVETADGELLGPAWPGDSFDDIYVYVQDLGGFVRLDAKSGISSRTTPIYFASDDCTGQEYIAASESLSPYEIKLDLNGNLWIWSVYWQEPLTLIVRSALGMECGQQLAPGEFQLHPVVQVEDPRYPYAAPLRFVTGP